MTLDPFFAVAFRPLKPGYEQLLKAGFKKGEQKEGADKHPAPAPVTLRSAEGSDQRTTQ